MIKKILLLLLNPKINQTNGIIKNQHRVATEVKSNCKKRLKMKISIIL